MGVSIRPLTVKDRKALSSMIKKLTGKVRGTAIQSLISSAFSGKKSESGDDGDDTKIVDLGVEIIGLALDTLDGEAGEWFASLLGVTVEEFEAMPMDTELDIIEQLKDSGGFKDFFTKASRLFSSIKKSANPQTSENE